VAQSSPGDRSTRARVALRFEIEETPGRWLMEEESVPETPLHDAIIELLMLVLKHWARTEARRALITSNLGCRWDPGDARVGVDPDVVLIEPAPPEGEQLTTLRIWEPEHVAPRVAVEVVSTNTAAKDYLEAPARCARLGVRELWIFDPRLDGPSDTGGPFTLQIWRAQEGSEMARVHAGPAPAFSEELGAWLIVAADGSRLRLAADAAGTQLWPTAAEAEAQRAEAEAQRAEAAEAEVARLRRLLDERGRG
jgi:Uma2 family endonuclease